MTIEQLYGLYYKRIVGLCATRIDRQRAEDAAQETFLKAWRHLDQFRGADYFPWLFVIALNVCRDMTKRKRTPLTAPIDAVAAEDVALASLEARRALEALRHLGPVSQRMLVMCVSMTNTEIAEQEGVKRSLVDERLCKARKALASLVAA